MSRSGPARLFVGAALLVAGAVAQAAAQSPERPPDTVVVRSGALELRALLWRPAGRGPFPAVLFNHGSGPARAPLAPHRTALGPVFARRGYAFLMLFRRGVGLSAGQGRNGFDVVRRAVAERGEAARNEVRLRRLETEDLEDVLAGLAYLRSLPEVDARRIAVAGHSFGGSLTLLVAERDTAVRAAVVFGGAAGSWDASPALRARLLSAVRRASVPVFFAYAANDYTVAPAKVLGAEMAKLGKPHRVEIYPPVGRTAEEGHDFVYVRPSEWERDVFAFLDERVRE